MGFGVFFALIDAVCSGYITDLFSETCLFFFFFGTQVFCLLAGGADVPVAAVNTQLAPKLENWSVFHWCCHVKSLLMITPTVSQMGAACSEPSELGNV